MSEVFLLTRHISTMKKKEKCVRKVYSTVFLTKEREIILSPTNRRKRTNRKAEFVTL